MTEIHLTTIINAPSENVFDLARNIDFHCKSASSTNEQAIAGVTNGLIGLGDEVTWRARHFLIWQKLSVRITQFSRPRHFRDEQVKGAFRSMCHDHYFEPGNDGSTEMRDVFSYIVPFGFIGIMFDKLFLKHYLRRFLVVRNAHIKKAAESDEWRTYVK